MKEGVEFPFTELELQEMKKAPVPSDLWKRAFNFYNANPKHVKVHLGCKSCFGTVMRYLNNVKPQ